MHFVQCALPPTEGLLQSKHQAGTWSPSSLPGSLLQARHQISEPAQQGQNMTAYPPKLNPRKLSISKISASPRAKEQILMKSHVTCFIPEQTYYQPRVHFCLVLIISGCKTFLPGQTSAKSGQLLGYELYHTYIIIVYFPCLESSHFYFILQSTLTLLQIKIAPSSAF